MVDMDVKVCNRFQNVKCRTLRLARGRAQNRRNFVWIISHTNNSRKPLSSLLCDVFLCFCHFPMRYPGSDMVVDCIDSCSLPSSVLYFILSIYDHGVLHVKMCEYIISFRRVIIL